LQHRPSADNRGVFRLDFFNPLYALSGLVIGAIVGMTGVGGGSLMTPVLVLLFGVSPATAVGTDLLYAAVTKSGGTLIHGYNRTISWPVVGLLAAGSAPASALTLFVIANWGSKNDGVSHLITVALGVALLLTAGSLLLRKQLRRAALASDPISAPRTRALTIVTGALLGFFVSISSVGAGALGVTALLLLYPRFATVRIVGTDIAHAVPLTLIAGAGHWWLGSVDWRMLASLLCGSLPGIALGSALAPRVPGGLLRRVLAVILTIVGIRLVLY
jgi:uncharacterized protein